MNSATINDILSALAKANEGSEVVYLETNCVDFGTKSADYWLCEAPTYGTIQRFWMDIIAKIMNASCQLDKEYSAESLFDEELTDANDRDIIIEICKLLLASESINKEEMKINMTYKGLMSLGVQIVFLYERALDTFVLAVDELLESLQEAKSKENVSNTEAHSPRQQESTPSPKRRISDKVSSERRNGKGEASSSSSKQEDIGEDDTDSGDDNVFASGLDDEAKVEEFRKHMDLVL